MPGTRSSSARRQASSTVSGSPTLERCQISTALSTSSFVSCGRSASSSTAFASTSSASSTSSDSRLINSDSSSHSISTGNPTLTEAQRETAFALSPAVDCFTTAEIRCAYCRRIFKLPCRQNNGAFDSANFKRHLRRAHEDEAKGRRVMKGPRHELMVSGLPPAPVREGERPLRLGAGCEDYVRRDAGAVVDSRVAEIESALREMPKEEAQNMENSLYWFTAVCELVRAI
ncbi:hypothetical protein K523DRAFT_374435 [Schizophyllum commune Tattone D]|nr:hypothetical protein K523DRAFT_374435 [Schizophyllum commune Tattone D]